MMTISPGSTSRTNWAPMRSSAGVSDASTHPVSMRPRHSGRKPCGSRTPTTWASSMHTMENAPSSAGQDLEHGPFELAVVAAVVVALDGLGDELDDEVAVGGAPRRCPGNMPARSARSAVLTRLPLWPRAIWWPAAPRATGWAFCHTLDPVVEYRVWPMARWPGSPLRTRSSNTEVTSPVSLTVTSSVPSETAMPAAS